MQGAAERGAEGTEMSLESFGHDPVFLCKYQHSKLNRTPDSPAPRRELERQAEADKGRKGCKVRQGQAG